MSTYHPLAYSRDWLDNELTIAVALLRELAEDTPCRLTPDGVCLAHDQVKTPCIQVAVRAFLEHHSHV
jgi:hypothetical protein